MTEVCTNKDEPQAWADIRGDGVFVPLTEMTVYEEPERLEVRGGPLWTPLRAGGTFIETGSRRYGSVVVWTSQAGSVAERLKAVLTPLDCRMRRGGNLVMFSGLVVDAVVKIDPRASHIGGGTIRISLESISDFTVAADAAMVVQAAP